MTPSEITQSVAGAIYMATITTVGIRLLVLARRNRGLPELLLGLSLLVGGTFGAVLEAAGMSGDVYMPPHVSGALLATGKAIGIVGFVSQAFFVRIVFRPSERWALGIVGFIAATLVATWIAFGLTGAYATGDMTLSIFLVELAARVIGSIWLIAESIRYYGFMKRRVALGIADPVVADRFRLWVIAGIAGLVLLATSVPPVIWPTHDSSWLEGLIPVFATSGVTASGGFLLAFFPPAWYRRWVVARLAPNEAAG